MRLLCDSEGFTVVGEAKNGVEDGPDGTPAPAGPRDPRLQAPRLDGEGAVEILHAVIPGAEIDKRHGGPRQRPRWADACLNKERISELMRLLPGVQKC